MAGARFGGISLIKKTNGGSVYSVLKCILRPSNS